ncbi:FN3 associated domain-containing protein [Paenibacillus hamazuiensis]|uniref:FN3 associated domain-containing protein n=1 Tax=Paenibacillus hamazuiensis TaxID=2936508 RepID=UPI00200DA61A|nr:FN3 associated domain-containing protein [Paenibacillus hamazuiensis]
MTVRQKSIRGIVCAVLLMAIFACAGAFLADASGERWSDHADTGWYNPVYTTFTIDTPAKLAGVAKLVNDGVSPGGASVNGFSGKILEIDRDLDLSAYEWVPIGTGAKPFKGTLIAAGGKVKDISGMTLTDNLTYAGFIGYMDGATVGGFKFTDTGSISMSSVTQDVYVGAAVGLMANNSILYDITNNVSISVDSVTKVTYAGGIVGRAEGIVSNLVNNGAVAAYGGDVYAGGITGAVDRNGLKLKKMWNYGAVSAASKAGKNVYAGGIAGHSSTSIKMDEESTAILNAGAVTASNGLNNYAGGILGKVSGEVTFSANTTNSGAVNVGAPSARGSYAGGLTGRLDTAGSMTLDFPFAAGTGAVANNGGSNVYTGAIAGYVEGSLTWTRSFTNNAGITASGKDHVYTGGLVGYISGNVQFSNIAKNKGDLQISGGGQSGQPDEAYTGGLVGYAAGRVIFESTAASAYENSGSITVSAGTGVYTGGIVSNRGYAQSDGKASENVSSTGNIKVTGKTKIQTGGYVGSLPADSADKTLRKAVFAGDITVAAASSGADNAVSTGGIVGYSAGAAIDSAEFHGTITAAGGTGTFTGGIAGYVDGGSVTGATVSKTPPQYAAITSDGSSGGVAGYLKGTAATATVEYITFTVTSADGFAGGVAGTAQGTISNATIGHATSKTSDSVKFAGGGGIDRVTAGGIVGHNDGPLTLASGSVAKIGLLSETGRTGYNLGAVAGSLMSDAKVGTAGSPVKVNDLVIDIKADNSSVGGAIGINRSPQIFLNVEGLTVTIPASGVSFGGAAGVQNAAAGTEAADGFMIAVNNVTLTAQGNNPQIGGIAGKSTGVIAGAKAINHQLSASGVGAEIGGIVGRSEAPDGSASPAVVKDVWVHAGENVLIGASGQNSTVGGIAGYAKNTEIQNPQIEAVLPDYATLNVAGAGSAAGGIAGKTDNGKIIGDAQKINADNLIVSGTADASSSYIGGIVGYGSKTRVEKVFSGAVNLIANGPSSTVGGMAGYNLGTDTAVIINNNTDALSIKVGPNAVSSTAGGVVGLNDKRAGEPGPAPDKEISTIQNSRIVGTISSGARASVTGGLVGSNRSLIANGSISDKISVVSKGEAGIAGGLAGLNEESGTLYYTYSNASLTIEGQDTLAGGLVGENKGRVLTSYVDIDITGNAYGTENGSVYLGGLVGRNSGTIDKSYSVSKVTANGSYTNVGGLVGDHAAGSITNSYAAKEVVANADHSYAGGLLGRITNGTVTTAYSAGRVSAASGALAGGFAGRYDSESKELLYKSYYVKDIDNDINGDLPDFADGNMIWLNVHARLSTILSATLQDRSYFPGLSGWDFSSTWRYGSLDAAYKYPELIRTANTGGGSGGSDDINASISWYMKDQGALSFELRSEAELAGLAAIVNGTMSGVPKFDFAGRTVKVKNSIHIQSKMWVPIGFSEDSPFQGTFNGNGQLIDGLSVLPNYRYSGLFGVVGGQGKIMNVKLEPLSVAGQGVTGALAGWNQGGVSNVDIKLLGAAKISGTTVGGAIGKNTGTLAAMTVGLDGASRVEGTGTNPVVGGFVGENTFALNPDVIKLSTVDGSAGSSQSNATIGGIVGKQTGDVTGMSMTVSAGYRLSSSGASSVLGGLVGQHLSGKAENITLAFTDGAMQTTGPDSTLGGVIGQSNADSPIRNVTVTAAAGGRQLTGNGIVGGIVGLKTGKGNNTFDLDNVKVENLAIAAADGSPQAFLGGIAGKLGGTAVRQAAASGAVKANGGRIAAGGIAGQADDSIIYMADAKTDIDVVSAAGEAAAGGIAGILSSADMNKSFDFGKPVPFYHGIYNASVSAKGIKAASVDNEADLYAGGIAGKNMSASIYLSASSTGIAVSGGSTATVGGIAGYSSGVIVSATVHSGIGADSSRVYHVGGVVGQAAGGEIHYSNAVSVAGQKIAVGSAVTKPGMTPATHAGGFAGTGDNTRITHSFADIPLEIVCDNQDNTLYAGGFAGMLGDAEPGAGTIESAYAKGAVSVKGVTGAYAGGFAGSVDRYTITDAYATGDISNTGFDTRSGGFAGIIERAAVVKKAYAAPATIATTGINQAIRSYAGGFAGYNDGAVESAFANDSELVMNVSGANVFSGGLIGYNFRNGKVALSSYLGSSEPVGRNLGAADIVKAESDRTDSYGYGNWIFDPDTSFLTGDGLAEIVIQSGKQLSGAVLLYNDTGLDYYRLFNRTAAAKPALNKFSLGADISVDGGAWVPFGVFNGEFDGKGKTISGFKGKSPAAAAYGFAAENNGKIANIVFAEADVTGGTNTGIVAGINRKGGTVSGVTVKGTVSGGAYTGGAIGKNEGSASNVNGESLTVNGADYTGGLTGSNSGTISSAAFSATTVAAAGSYTGGVAGDNSGTIANAALNSTAVTGGTNTGLIVGINRAGGTVSGATAGGTAVGGSYTGGTAGTNEGSISKITIRSLIVNGADYTGGAAGKNAGNLSDINAESLTVNGADYAGGFAGLNGGSIEKMTAASLAVTGSGSHTGGVAGDNGKTITNAALNNVTVTGAAGTGLIAGTNRAGATVSGITAAGAVTGGDYTGGAVGTNEGAVSDVTISSLTLKGGNYAGGLTGLNKGSLEGIAVNAVIEAGSYTGGITGENEGLIRKAYSKGSIRNAPSAAAAAAGGIAGVNKAGGEIASSFSFADVDIVSDQGAAGGIAGMNYGSIHDSYYSGRAKAEGTAKVWAGGIAGRAVAGSISQVMNYGEIIASIGGKVVPGGSYFGGIAGQKEDAAVIGKTAYNKMMLKADTAYYNAEGKRTAGAPGEAAGMTAKDLAKGTLPEMLSSDLWYAAAGFYPQLTAFKETNASKVSAAAVMFDLKDTVGRIKSEFELTGSPVVWTADPNAVSLSSASGVLKGSLKSAGSVLLTATVNGESRSIAINDVLPFAETALKPRVISGDIRFNPQVSVALTTDETAGKIYYTVDGSEPDVWSKLYTGPILLTNTTTIRAVTIADEKENSEILSGTWTKQVMTSGGGIRSGGGGGGGFFPTPAAEQEPAPASEPAIKANVGQTRIQTDGKSAVIVARNSKLTLSAPEGQIIYYTTDGSTPTKNSPQYKDGILITGNMTIKMITDKDDTVVTIHYLVEDAKFALKSDAGQVKYISGYENNEFKPDAALSRYEIMYLLSPLLDKEEVPVGNVFGDVDKSMEELAAFFTSAGIIEGYPEGTFGGEKGLTRAEFVVIMSRVLKLDISEAGETVLSDVSGHWAEKYVDAFTKAGYVEGFPDGTFQPDSRITRAQAVVLVNRIIGKQKQQDVQPKFSDLPPTHWAFEDVMAAAR